MKKKRYANDIIPGEAFHPCETVREELEAQGKTQSDLAKASNLDKSFISRFMKGERAISARFALALEEVLGIPAEFWIRLQKGYESDLELIELKKIKQSKNDPRQLCGSDTNNPAPAAKQAGDAVNHL